MVLWLQKQQDLGNHLLEPSGDTGQAWSGHQGVTHSTDTKENQGLREGPLGKSLPSCKYEEMSSDSQNTTEEPARWGGPVISVLARWAHGGPWGLNSQTA